MNKLWVEIYPLYYNMEYNTERADKKKLLVGLFYLNGFYQKLILIKDKEINLISLHWKRRIMGLEGLTGKNLKTLLS